MSGEVARLVLSVQADLGNAVSELGKLNNSLSNFASKASSAGQEGQQAMGGIASSLQRVAEFAAGNLLTGGVSALTGAFHDAVSAGADFGSVVNKIQAVGDVTAKYGDQAGSVMDRVRAKALQLGADLPISAKTAADGILELVASGMEVEQAMEASTGVSQLAAAHMLEVGRSAEIVGVALNGFKMRADEAGRAADVLSQIANASAADVNDLGETFKYVAPVAGAAGQSIEQMGVAIGLMANQGIKGSQAGTALRQMLARMEAPGKDTAAWLDTLGVQVTDSSQKVVMSTKEMKAALTEWKNTTSSAAQQGQLIDALNQLGMAAPMVGGKIASAGDQFKVFMSAMNNDNIAVEQKQAAMEQLGLSYTRVGGNMLPMVDILKQMREGFKNLSGDQKAQAATAIAGMEGMSGLLAMVDVSQDKFDAMVEAMSSATGATERFSAATNQGFGFQWEQLQGSIETVLIQGFMAVEPILIALATQATTFVNALGSGISSVTPALKVVSDAIAAVVNAAAAGKNPVTALADALKGVVSGDVVNVLYAVGDAVAALADGGNPFGQLADSLGEFGLISETASGQLMGMDGAFDGLSTLMGTISGAVSTLVGNVQTLLPVFLAVANGATPLEAINSAMSSGASAAQVMAAAASPIGGIMMGIAQSISAMGGLGAVFTAIAGAVGGVLVAIVGLAVFADIAAAISGGAALIVGAILFILSPIGMVLAAAALLGAAYATNFGGMRDSINQVAGLLGSTLLIAAQGAGNVLKTVFGALPGLIMAVSPTLQSLASTVGAILVGAFTALKGVAAAVFGALPGIVGTVMGTLTSLAVLLQGPLGAAFNAVKNIALSIFAGLPALAQAVMGVIGALAQVVGNVLVGAMRVVAPIAQAIFTGISNFAAQAIPPIMQLATVILNGIRAALVALAPVVSSAFAAFAAGIAPALPAIQQFGTFLGAAIGQAVQRLIPVVQSFFDQLPGWITAAQPAITTIASLIGSVFGGVIAGALQVVGNIIGWVANNWEMLSSIVAGVAAAWGTLNIIATVSGWIAAASAFIGGLIGAVTAIVGPVMGFIGAVGGLGSALSWVIGIISAVVGALLSPVVIIAAIIGAIVALAVAWFTNVGGIQEKTFAAMEAVKGAFQSAITTIGGFINSAVTTITTAWNTGIGTLSTKAQEAWNAVSGVFQGAVATVGGMVGGIVSAITSPFTSGAQQVSTSAGTMMTGAGTAITAAGPALVTQLQGIVTQLQTAWDTGLANLTNVVTTLQTGLSTAFQTAFAAVAATVTTLLTPIVTAIQTGIAGMMAFIQPVLAGFAALWGPPFMAAVGVVQAAVGLIAAIMQLLVAVVTLAATAAAGIWQNVFLPPIMAAVGVVQAAWGSIVAAFNSGVAAVTGVMTAIATTIVTQWAALSGAVTAQVTAQWASITNQFNMGVALVNSLIAFVVAFVVAQWTTLVASVTAQVTQHWAALTALFAQGQAFLSAVIAMLVATIMVQWQLLSSTVQAYTQAMWVLVQALFAAGQAMLMSVVQSIVGTVFGMWQSGIETLQGVWGTFWSFLQGVGDWIGGTFGPIVTGFVGGAMAVWDGAVSASNSLWSGTLLPTLQAVSGFISGALTGALNGISNAITGAVSGALNVFINLVQNLTGALGTVQSAISGVTKAIKKLADAISNISLPGWMTPGSPMPLEPAMWGLGAAVGKATSAMSGFNAATSNASIPDWLTPGSPTPLERGLIGIAHGFDRVASSGNVKTQVDVGFAINGAQNVANSAQALAALGAQIATTYGNAGKSIEKSVLDGAKQLQDGLNAASGGMNATIALIPTLLNFGSSAEAAAISVGSSRASMLNLVSMLASFASDVMGRWGAAGNNLSEAVKTGAKALQDGITAAAGGLKATLDAFHALLSFQSDIGPMVANVPGFLVFMLQVADLMSSMARQIVDRWGGAGETLSADAVSGATRLKDGIVAAAAGLKATTDAFNALLSFQEQIGPMVATVPGFLVFMLEVAQLMASMARQIVDRWGGAGQTLSADAVAGATRLKDGIIAASAGLKATTEAINGLLAFQAAFGPIMATAPGFVQYILDTAQLVASIARQITDRWGAAGATLSSETVGGAQRLKDGVEAASVGIKSTFEAITGLLKFDTEFSGIIAVAPSFEGYVAGLAETVARLARLIADAWGGAGQGLSSEVVSGAQRLKDGIEAALAGIKATTDAINALFNFTTVLAGLNVGGANLNSVVQDLARQIAGLARTMVNEWSAAGASLSAEAVAAAQKLQHGIEAASSGIKAAFDLLGLLSGALKNGTVFLDTATAQSMVGSIAAWAAAVANSFGEAAGALRTALQPQADKLSAAIQNTLTGMKAAFDLLSLINGVLENGPVSLDSGLAEELTYFVAEWAAGVANSFGEAAAALNQGLTETAKKLTDAIQNSLGGLKAAFDLLSLINGVLENGPVALDNSSAEELAWFIADWAAGVANSYGDAAKILDQSLLDGAKKLTEAIQNALGGLKAAFELLSLINGVLEDGPVSLNNSSAEELAWFIADWAAGVANSYGDAAKALDQSLLDGAKKLTEAIQNALGGLKAAFELLTLINGVLEDGPVALNNSSAEELAWFIADWAAGVANSYGDAAKILDQSLLDGAKKLTEAIQNALGGLKAAFELLSLINGVLEDGPVALNNSSAEELAWFIADWAAGVANSYGDAAQVLNQSLLDGAKKLTEAIQNTLGGLKAAFELLSLINGVLEDGPVALDNSSAEELAWFIADWAAGVANSYGDAAQVLNQSLTDGAKKLTEAIQNALGGLKAAVETVQLISGVANAETPLVFNAGYETWAANLGTWGARLANAFAGATSIFNAALAPAAKVMADALATAFEGLKAAVELVALISGVANAEEPLTFGETFEAWATNLGQWGVKLTNAFNGATSIFNAALAPAAKVMADAMKSALDGLMAAVQLVTLISAVANAEKPLTFGPAYETWATNLGQWGAKLANAFASATATFNAALAPAAKVMADALKNALDGLVAALGIVRLVEGVVNAEQPPTFGPTFETWAANLGLWGAKLANAFAASTNVFNATLAPAAKVMADGLAVAFSGLKAALDLVRLIAGAQGAEQPVTFNEGMVTLATNLGQWGARLANAFADATGIFDATVAPTAKVMADTIQTALEGIRATIQLLQSLSGFQAEPVQNIEALISLAQVLSAYAARLGSAFATAASGFDSVVNDGVKALGETIQTTSEALTATVGMLKMLSVYLDEPVLDVEAAIQQARLLGDYARRLASQFATTASGFDAVTNDGVKALAEGIKSTADALTSTIGLVKALANYASEPVVYSVVLETMARDLGVTARRLALQFATTALGFDTFANNGVKALGETVKGALDALSATIEILKTLSDFASTPLTFTDALFNLAADLGRDARRLATAFANTAAGFDTVINDGVKALADGIGSAASALADTIGLLPKLTVFLPNYQGFPVYLETQLGVLVDDIKTIFLAFAQRAKDARITEAGKEAAGVLADGFGSALDAINGAMELMEKLLNPESRPHISNNVSYLLDPIFNFIDEITKEFTRRAKTYQATDLQAGELLGSSVGSVFDAILKVSEAIQSFTGIYLGTSGFNNISTMLDLMFNMFDRYSGKAAAAQSVATVIATVAGALANLKSLASGDSNWQIPDLSNLMDDITVDLPADLAALGTSSGNALMNSLAAAIRGGKDAVVAALQGVAAALQNVIPGMVVGGQRAFNRIEPQDSNTQRSSAPTTQNNYTYNYYYTLVQYVDPATGGQARNSFQGMSSVQPN